MSEHIPASEMVKRVAEALCVASGMNQNNWQHKQHLARAAIEAMMERPPDSALVAGQHAVAWPGNYIMVTVEEVHDIYRAVLSEALSPSLKEQEDRTP